MCDDCVTGLSLSGERQYRRRHPLANLLLSFVRLVFALPTLLALVLLLSRAHQLLGRIVVSLYSTQVVLYVL
ncbi:hypothetical protein SCLCIDRAFT_1214367 [Scleroderma citrinum Foug A]|uniref:Uncharacterized protein n=1 Tax=Scleroderma citrinum Foug A TaxID=1036808 RepID=A0A0C3DRG8_9AGAM|nr:hypothetical protein SCLCIDRAFT_1214367 [Scleroderma citrinum Foug A]